MCNFEDCIFQVFLEFDIATMCLHLHTLLVGLLMSLMGHQKILTFYLKRKCVMSYEGRECYICPKGHILIGDCYDFVHYSETGPEIIKQYCPHCNEKMEWIGGIDDTNGEALYTFKLIEITPELRKTNTIKLDDFTMVTTVVYRPGTYSVVKDKLCRNFDTGEEYNKYNKEQGVL